MIRWVKSSLGPVRRPIYFVGMIVTFFAAIGVGASSLILLMACKGVGPFCKLL
jgi:hypothetical protein